MMINRHTIFQVEKESIKNATIIRHSKTNFRSINVLNYYIKRKSTIGTISKEIEPRNEEEGKFEIVSLHVIVYGHCNLTALFV